MEPKDEPERDIFGNLKEELKETIRRVMAEEKAAALAAIPDGPPDPIFAAMEAMRAQAEEPRR